VAVTLPCPAEHWPLFSTLLDEALALPDTGYEAWLAALEGDRATLRPWLACVLAAAAAPATARFLGAPALLADTGLETGDAVGPFCLVRRLGEGGMGEVWLADRAEDGPRRQVALKLPHAFLLGAEARMRFQRERDVVAGLAHPNIAQLYEAGVSSGNVPYLALEYVDGTPITGWCREQSLPLDQRLALTEKVLDALGYAHRRLIVHRDIKPSNILVTAEGQVKLLDFGIAKLLGDAAETGDLTQPAARLATPDYAAPEQLRGDTVTVSTDLFAVGAVLFELVTGVRPFSTSWRSPDQEAPLASTRADPKASRSPLGARLARALRGDLDAILAKALAPDPARRYPSADAFARDLACFRAGLPVSARRVGWITRAGKFVRRQRLASALAAACALAVAAGVGGVAWQAERAERAAARANVIKDFLIGVFQVNDPRVRHDKPPGEVTAKELLDAAAARLDSGFAGDPESELEIMDKLSDIYEFMEDAPRAESLEARRVELSRRLHGPNDPVVLRVMLDQAWDDAGFDDYGKAKTVLAEIRDRIPATFGGHSHERGLWLMEWAYALAATPGARDESRRDESEAAGIFASETPTPDDYPTAQDILGRFEMDSYRFSEALKTFEAAAAADRALGEFDPIEAMIYDVHSAQALQNLGRPDEADRRYRVAATQADRTMGRHSSVHFQALMLLADLLRQRGEREEADRIFRLLDSEADKADTPPGMAMRVKETYGAALVAEGRPAAALPVLGAALGMARVRPHGVADLPRIQQALGEAEEQLGRRAAAGPLLAAARTAWMGEGPANAPWVLGARERWARFEMAGGAAAIAAAECQAIVKAAGRTPSAPVALAQADLARLALMRGDVGAARDDSAAALNTMSAATGLYDVRSWIPVWRARAFALAAVGDAAGAKAWTKRASDAARRYGAP
jgi:eukaryotic-like serine/threonine-protein kinase